AEAIGKLAVGTANAADGDAGAAEKALHKGRQFGRIVEGKPGTEKIGVGINGNAGRRGVVATNIADDAEPVFGVIRDRAAEAVLVESAGTAEAEVGVAGGDVNGLVGGRSREQGKGKAKR